MRFLPSCLIGGAFLVVVSGKSSVGIREENNDFKVERRLSVDFLGKDLDYWKLYRKEYRKQGLKPCSFLTRVGKWENLDPTTGDACPPKAALGDYMCIMGSQECPAGQMSSVVPMSLTHPKKKCKCVDQGADGAKFECEDFDPKCKPVENSNIDNCPEFMPAVKNDYICAKPIKDCLYNLDQCCEKDAPIIGSCWCKPGGGFECKRLHRANAEKVCKRHSCDMQGGPGAECGGYNFQKDRCQKGLTCVPNESSCRLTDCPGTCLMQVVEGEKCGGFLPAAEQPVCAPGLVCEEDLACTGLDCPGICVKKSDTGSDGQAGSSCGGNGPGRSRCKEGLTCVPNDVCTQGGLRALDCPGICRPVSQEGEDCGGFRPIGETPVCAKGLECQDDPSKPLCTQATDCPGVCKKPVDTAPGTGELGGFCGGFAGFPCNKGLVCVDDPSDNCSPPSGADCGGICVKDSQGSNTCPKQKPSKGDKCAKPDETCAYDPCYPGSDVFQTFCRCTEEGFAPCFQTKRLCPAPPDCPTGKGVEVKGDDEFCKVARFVCKPPLEYWSAPGCGCGCQPPKEAKQGEKCGKSAGGVACAKGLVCTTGLDVCSPVVGFGEYCGGFGIPGFINVCDDGLKCVTDPSSICANGLAADCPGICVPAKCPDIEGVVSYVAPPELCPTAKFTCGSFDFWEDKDCGCGCRHSGKSEWPELVGTTKCNPDAIKQVKADRPDLNVVVCISQDMAVTLDIRDDRVRLFFDEETGLVSKTPVIM